MRFGTVGDVTTSHSAPTSVKDVSERILEVTADLLAVRGFDGLQLRDVAWEARVSLRDIYKRFPSRDDLVVASVERWMATHVYTPALALQPGESMPDHLVRSFGLIFKPWRENPAMLKVFLRAAVLPGGERLGQQGYEAVEGSVADEFAGADPELVNDLSAILPSLVSGLLTRFSSGEIEVDEIVRVYERAVRRLVKDAP